MDWEGVGETRNGKLVPITGPFGKEEWAFVPHDLPPVGFNQDAFWPLIVEANKALATLYGVGLGFRHSRLLMRPLQRKEALHSNSIEGTVVSPKELLLFEAMEKDDDEPRDRLQAELREVLNYAKALHLGINRLEEGHALNTRLLQELHAVLLRGVRGEEKRPGELRTVQAHIGAGHRYTPPPPDDVPGCMENFDAFIAHNNEYDGLVKAYLAHYQFEAIHPFVDGNGRIGRVQLALMTTHFLGMPRPVLYMSEYFDRHRDDYISLLYRTSMHGEWDAWVEFCLVGTIEQAGAALKQYERLRAIRREYLQVARKLTSRAERIVEAIFDNAIITIVDIRDVCEVHYDTARRDVEKLVEARVLEPVSGTHPAAYCATELFRAVYLS